MNAVCFRRNIKSIYWAGRLLNNRNICSNIGIFVESLKSFSSMTLLIRQCKKELNWIEQQSGIADVYIDHSGNKQVDKLARLGSAHSISKVVLVFRLFKNTNLNHFLLMSDSRWRFLNTYNRVKMTWPSYNFKCTMLHNPRYITRLLSIVTGHWHLGKRGSRFGLTFAAARTHEKSKQFNKF